MRCIPSLVSPHASPAAHSKIIAFVSDKNQPAWHGYFYAVLMVCVNMLMSAVLNQYFLVMMTLGMRVRTTLIAAVYRKVRMQLWGLKYY